ncbi:hypothetical protein L873DRAFT_688691 [Choiromyces venosus 120613-1]|uniref:Uncharacterized protein n=1 Tax=Choiromyces venosus 120613-1 TaxID=1336337 RepID=A0A3N4JVT8_9PEZI|nr:hypothetical protein L873DRAFT_688691 [Choiromyces venosus 120613-1]
MPHSIYFASYLSPFFSFPIVQYLYSNTASMYLLVCTALPLLSLNYFIPGLFFIFFPLPSPLWKKPREKRKEKKTHLLVRQTRLRGVVIQIRLFRAKNVSFLFPFFRIPPVFFLVRWTEVSHVSQIPDTCWCCAKGNRLRRRRRKKASLRAESDADGYSLLALIFFILFYFISLSPCAVFFFLYPFLSRIYHECGWQMR